MMMTMRKKRISLSRRRREERRWEAEGVKGVEVEVEVEEVAVVSEVVKEDEVEECRGVEMPELAGEVKVV